MYIIIIGLGVFLTLAFLNSKKYNALELIIVNFALVTACVLILLATITFGYLESKSSHIYEYKDLNILSYEENSNVFIVGRTPNLYIMNGSFDKGIKKIKTNVFSTYIKKGLEEQSRIENFYKRKVRLEKNSKIMFNVNRKEYEWEKNTSDNKILFLPLNAKFKDLK